MRAVTYYELSDSEKRTLTDHYLPLYHLCNDAEQAEQVARLVRGNTAHYSAEQVTMLALAVADLHDVVWSQACTSYWQGLGMPEPKGLAQMRSAESIRLHDLLESLTMTTAKVA